MHLCTVPEVPEYRTLFMKNVGSDDVQYTLQECEQDGSIMNFEMQQIRKDITSIKKEIVNLKEEIRRHYNKTNLHLDKIYKILSEINIVPSNIAVYPLPKENLLQAFSFPLVSCEQIQALDNEIRNNLEFKSQLITYLSKTGGTSREEDGGKVAYKVIDQMFDPSVLINYTWTGVARGKNSTKKRPFQILEGILDVFFQVISLADSRHTVQKNCNIFKEGVLKYATKRSLRKRSKFGYNDARFVHDEETDYEAKSEDVVHNVLNANAEKCLEEWEAADGEDSE